MMGLWSKKLFYSYIISLAPLPEKERIIVRSHILHNFIGSPLIYVKSH